MWCSWCRLRFHTFKIAERRESGRKKINQITRWLTIGICFWSKRPVIWLDFHVGCPLWGICDGPVCILLCFFHRNIGNRLYFFAMWLGEKLPTKESGMGSPSSSWLVSLRDCPKPLRKNSYRGLWNQRWIDHDLDWIGYLVCDHLLSVMLVMAVRKDSLCSMLGRTASGGYEKYFWGTAVHPIKVKRFWGNAHHFCTKPLCLFLQLLPACRQRLGRRVKATFSDILGFGTTLYLRFWSLYSPISILRLPFLPIKWQTI